MLSKRLSLKPKLRGSTASPLHDWAFEAIGTNWWIGIYEPVAADAFSEVKAVVSERITKFDKTYSRFRNDSVVAAIAENAGTYTLPTDADELFAMYRQLYDASNGLVTPLIGQVLSDAGYDANYSLQAGKLLAPPAWDEVMNYADGVLTTTQPVLLDFGAAGKGYLVDIIAALLHNYGINQFCVDAGGDMVCSGLEVPLRIGLEDPNDSSQVIGVTKLQNGALCGSAGNRRAWGSYHHIINPIDLESPRHIESLWVMAENGVRADGIATALFFAAPEKLVKAFTFSYFILYADGSVKRSSDFASELFMETSHV